MRNTLSRSFTVLPLAALALALPACSKQATGQVAAVVNGDEVTLQEVNAEIGNAKIPEGAQKDKARQVILSRLVDKRLLEQQAKSAGLDRDPEFLLKQRQLTQALLIQMYAKRAADTLKVPDQAAIGQYMASHPDNFANRVVYSVDQIRFAPPQNPAQLQGLKDVHTMEGVATYLKDQGIPFQRGNAKIDSATVPEAMLKQVMAVPAGEPFIVPTPQGVIASVITGKEASPLPPAQGNPLAVQMIRSQNLENVMQQRLKDARASAKIEYQPGYGPVPGASGTPAK